MKMEQFNDFVNKATDEMLGVTELEQENLNDMFHSYSPNQPSPTRLNAGDIAYEYGESYPNDSVGKALNDFYGELNDLKVTVDSVCDYVGYTESTYTGGYELGKISQVTGNNNQSSSRVRTVTFLDNTHDNQITISQDVMMQVFEYNASDGTFNNYYVNLVYNSPNQTHNALTVSDGVIVIHASTQYKYKLDFLDYPIENPIANVDDFISDNVTIEYVDIIPINEAISTIQADVSELKSPQIQKTWACYGDSITQLDLYENAVRTMLGITTLYRRGVAGCSIAENSASAAVAGENTSIVYRIVNEVNFPNNPEIITILAGVNDYLYGSPIGNMGSTSTSTLYGALKAICEKLASLSYQPKIVFITPTKKTPGQASTAIDNTVTQDQVRQAIIDVSGAYGYPVIDLGGTCGINTANVSRSTNPTTSDGTHWSTFGSALCVPIIADGLRKVFYK